MRALQSRSVATDWPTQLANVAVEALLQEARLTPKPGLVDQRGSGVHQDLTLELMELSAHTLWDTFYQISSAAQGHQWVNQLLRETLGHEGRLGEEQMLQATSGVNTHRGAIWALGLLTAALSVKKAPKTVTELLSLAGQLASYPDRFLETLNLTNGARARAKYGVDGAREQAQKGFPQVLDGLEQLYLSRTQGADEQSAQLDALLAIISRLTDTCVIHRAGLEGMNWLQSQATQVLQAGGYSQRSGQKHYQTLETGLVARNGSPGGAADLLSVCLFVDALVEQGVIAWKL
ncbi:MAG: triphosphoribosyl-dephospho-CoA synthase [Pseudomonas sp.]|nr:triphosphoribosyl-dephospho-CoA synthase [Pseudomonas sp.]